MAKVLNKTDKSLQVERWTIFAGGTRCVNQYGLVREELPDSVAYGPVVQHLLSLDLVSLNGVPRKVSPVPPVPPVEETKEPDQSPDEQEPGWGSGLSKSQRKKLRADKRS